MSKHSESLGPHLGKNSSYPDRYDPNLLVGIDRARNRDAIGYDSAAPLPFAGFDLWNAWEVSALLDCGLPWVGALRITYDATSPRLVESKSFKLYLNSFNQEPLGSDANAVCLALCARITEDLSPVLGVRPTVTPWVMTPETQSAELKEFQTLEVLHPQLPIRHYAERRELLETASTGGSLKAHSALLRSRCRATGQPDWGDVYASISGNHLPDTASLLAYWVSFRQEQHFHEEIVESIYHALMSRFEPERLMVAARYTRRGGLDINPVRYNVPEAVPECFMCPAHFCRTFRQ